jgi:hypothetical protein
MDFTNIVFAVVIALVFITIAVDTETTEAPGRGWATILALAATVLSLTESAAHLTHYNQPRRQRLVIRILFMVPFYATNSLWSFFDRRHASTIDLLRDTYEAFVVFNFFHLLLDLNGGVADTVNYWRARKPTMPHMFPLRGNMVLDRRAISLWQGFVLQYVFVSPLCTCVTYALTANNDYDENSWSLAGTHLWISIVRCISVTFAFTALLYFYLATKYNIHDANPTGKFMSIKAVIFLGCWQGVVIAMLDHFGLFPETKVRDFLFKAQDPVHPDAAVAALENWLVIVEMFLAVVAHHFVFSYKGFPSKHGERLNSANVVDNLKHALSVADVAEETALSTKNVRTWVSPERRRAAADDAIRRPQQAAGASSASGPAKPWRR